MIPVTKPFLPPLERYQEKTAGIWKRGWLTNNGPLLNELEVKLKEHLGLDHLLYVTNGTIALQMAIKALDLKGEILTTPFSYVATTSSIVWENCSPVFVDISQETLNVDSSKIEAAITDKTSGMLFTHVYGNPCDVERIESIAQKHGLKVIYDAAHAFGVKLKGRSLFEYGDISTTSFHATKLYHTIEGGAVFTKDSALFKKLVYHRNFGHDGPENFAEVGINAKNSEFHAGMGLLNLEYIDAIITKRRELSTHYDEKLSGFKCHRPKVNMEQWDYNYAYYPILVESEEYLKELLDELNKNWIYPRRYFYPSLGDLPYVEKVDLPVADDLSRRVLCLPLYYDLGKEEVDLICRIMLGVQNS